MIHPAFLLAAALQTITLPFSYVHHEILVAATVNGSGPYTFLLDTDTTPSAIDLSLARKLRVSIAGQGDVGGGVGSRRSRVFPATIQRVNVGAVSAERLDAVAIDLSGLSAQFGRTVGGVLGTSFLRDRVVQINYPCRTVSFLPDAVLEPFTASFEADGSGDNVSNDVWVGSHRISATFDTGDSGYGFVTNKGVADLHLESAARNGKAAAVYGYNGIASETNGTLNAVRIGRLDLGSLDTEFLRSTGDPFDLNIGNKTLDRYVVTFDYQRNLVTIDPPRPCATGV